MSFELFQAAKNNDGYAIGDLLQKLTPDLNGIVYHYLGDRYSTRLGVDDVVQETLMQIARDIASCTAEDWKQFMCWVYFVARNTTYKQVELIKLGRSPMARTQAIGDSWEAASSRVASPEESAMLAEQMQEVLQLAAGISANGVEICVKLSEGWTPAEIAAEMQITVSEVYSLRRSLKDAANLSGVYQTRKSDAWSKTPSPQPKQAATVSTVPMAQQIKAWKKFADQVRSASSESDAVAKIQYIDKQLNRMPYEIADQIKSAINYESLMWRHEQEPVSVG